MKGRPWTDSELRFIFLGHLRRRPHKWIARGLVARSVASIKKVIYNKELLKTVKF